MHITLAGLTSDGSALDFALWNYEQTTPETPLSP